jgi:hypothetical protein
LLRTLNNNAKGGNMATVKGLYDLIKKRQAEGEKIGILEQSIIEAYEADEPKQTTKEVHVSFIKYKKQKD